MKKEMISGAWDASDVTVDMIKEFKKAYSMK
jgi:hypothetical protein